MPSRTASEGDLASEKVLYEPADAGVATITLNDPDTRNALSPQLLDGLAAAFERAREEEQARCVVL
ncbi:MAG TPA: enoyl-CoA hydratase-related protein, partial [Solirubrobacteraceae bacterium]|nr:enoyl-CoA hydratase-related protein [Solirubrobacteraceae bacterium]